MPGKNFSCRIGVIFACANRCDKIRDQVDLLESLPNDVGMVYSDSFLIDDDGNDLPGSAIKRLKRLNNIRRAIYLRRLLNFLKLNLKLAHF